MIIVIYMLNIPFSDEITFRIVMAIEEFFLIFILLSLKKLFYSKVIHVDQNGVCIDTTYFWLITSSTNISREDIWGVVVKRTKARNTGRNITVEFQRKDVVIRTRDTEYILANLPSDEAVKLRDALVDIPEDVIK